MVKWIPLLLLLLAANILAAQTAYVAAPSGLKLRKTADAKGVIITTLPYQTAVEYLVDQSPQVAHKTKEAEGFYLNGFWQKVLAGKDTGYVFDAFLLPVKPLGEFEVSGDYDDTTEYFKPFEFEYLDSRFSISGKVYDVVKFADANFYSEGKRTVYNNKSYKQDYDNGNITAHFVDSEGVGGNTVTFTFKKYTLAQVYAMALGYTKLGNTSPIWVYYKDKEVHIEPIEIEPGCYSTITIKKATIVWQLYCGC